MQDDFFNSKRIKKLRKLAGGDTFTIIYLKMQLLSIRNNGCLEYTGLEQSFAEEIALDIDEDAENVKVTIQYLLSCGLLETENNIDYVLPYAKQNIGSETASTIRSRECREKQKMLQCNTDATLLQHSCSVEKEIEKDIEIYKDKKHCVANAPKKFVKPTVEDVNAYCRERNNGINGQAFVDFYESKGWLIGKNPMKDWKAAVRTWENKNKKSTSGSGTQRRYCDNKNEDDLSDLWS